MNKNYTYINREKEAKAYLNFWLEIANSESPDNEHALDVLEAMIYIFNVFSNVKCEINYNMISDMYEFDFFE